uniref:GB1/RHD3-type G domain-containing protein n=1 Tax=Plectus sambesii TaxID=2011161 RepID=A0A914XQZ3_9BILA
MDAPASPPPKFIQASSSEGSDDEGVSEPGPIRIIEAVEEDHTFVLNEKGLARILLNPKIADKKVAVVSVAGAFRKGKSFLLNFFLRYLHNPEAKNSAPDADWLGVDNNALTGFSWRGGSERETSGIMMWSEPFIVKTASGEEVAVLLMDTQGAFDSQSTVKDCATIFALSTMVSSVQIFNLSQNVQEDDLQHLQLFTEYGRLALESSDSKPFQSLLFLVRDWSFPYEAEYGFLGGNRILERRLQLSDKQHPELQQLRQHIRSCFENIQCFLMPHPGLRVATHPDFRGQIGEIEAEFKQQLRTMVPRLLNGQSLVLKEINGQKVTCRELLEYFRAYIKIFQGEVLPEPKSMLMATAEANNLAAVASAKALYYKLMEEICGGDTPYMSTAELTAEHERTRDEAVKIFRTARKMGGDQYSEQFLEKLDEEIFTQFEGFVKVNNGKNLFKSMRTPAVLIAILIVDYLFQELFQLLGLNTFANMCSLFLGIVLITLCTWAYTRYSGDFREAGMFIDELTTWIWTNVLAPLTQEGVQKAIPIYRKLTEKAAHNSTRPAYGQSNSTSSSKGRPRRYTKEE